VGATCFLLFVILSILCVLVATGAVGPGPYGPGRFRVALQQLGVRYRGRTDGLGRLAYPLLEFQHRSTKVRVRRYEADLACPGPGTEVRIEWPDPEFRCEVLFQPVLARRPLRDPLPTLTIEAAPFPADYSVRGSDARQAAQVLNDNVRWQIEMLRRAHPRRSLSVSFERGHLSVRQSQVWDQFPDLLRFVQLSLELYDHALAAQSHGIHIVEDTAVHPLEEVRCRVCGEAIGSDLVFCRRCKTPHHRDCWQYNGLCSVFGCGETQCDTPRIALPTFTNPRPDPQTDHSSET
jgi:hypothetical protein